MTLAAFDAGTDDLLVDVTDSIATFTLNRPDRLNAFSPEMLAGLSEGLRIAERDADVRAIVLTGAGRGFCAGGDVQNQKARATAKLKASSKGQI